MITVVHGYDDGDVSDGYSNGHFDASGNYSELLIVLLKSPQISSQIEAYNSSGAEAVQQVQESVRRLDGITEEINQTRSILTKEFYDNVRDNDQTLEALSKVTSRLQLNGAFSKKKQKA